MYAPIYSCKMDFYNIYYCRKVGNDMEQLKKNKVLIIIGIIVIVIIVGIVLKVNGNKSKQKDLLQQQEQDYNDLLTQTGAEMYLYGLLAQYHSAFISDIWTNCIYEKDNTNTDPYTKETQIKTYSGRLSKRV